MRRKRRTASNVVFLDLIMNALLSFVALFILAFVQINPVAKQDQVLETEGKYVVVMAWEDGSPDDVDLYVRDPLGNIAYFSSRDVGLMHLEHDDLGSRSDTVHTERGDITVDKNQERVILRGVVPGEYVVNVHMYSKRAPTPARVRVSLYRLKGADTEIASRERVLAASGDERTAFRFTVNPDESVTNIIDLPRSLVGSLRNGP